MKNLIDTVRSAVEYLGVAWTEATGRLSCLSVGFDGHMTLEVSLRIEKESQSSLSTTAA